MKFRKVKRWLGNHPFPHHVVIPLLFKTLYSVFILGGIVFLFRIFL
ncbi:MAG TPA: hypothetical protein VLX68_15080 [Chitinivibrionales bacterium]|nr:hypothetical protein [Chitinivibrionales bacterium]